MKIFNEYTWEKIKHSKLLLYGTAVLFLSLLVLFGLNQKRYETARRNEIRANPTIVVGQVQRLKKVYRNHDRFEYTFYFNSHLYSGWSVSNGKGTDYSNLSGHLYNRFFPVLLNAKDPQKYSSILIVPEDFAAYGLEFPDSLRWVLTYLDR
jgi:hypothetical protein